MAFSAAGLSLHLRRYSSAIVSVISALLMPSSLAKIQLFARPPSTSLRHASGPSENFARSVSQDHERCRGGGRSEKRPVDVDRPPKKVTRRWSKKSSIRGRKSSSARRNCLRNNMRRKDTARRSHNELAMAVKNTKGAKESKLQAGFKLAILALVFSVLNKEINSQQMV